MSKIAIPFIGLEDNKLGEALTNSLRDQTPSDMIWLDREADLKIMSLWNEKLDEVRNVPADLFFTKTIPLEDCHVAVDESDDGFVFGCRVHIKSDYKDSVERVVSGKSSVECVGLLIVDNGLGDHLWFVGLCIAKGNDYLMMSQPTFTKHEITQDDSVMNAAIHTTGLFGATWYGIQIALLHPTIKEVFSHPKIEIFRESSMRERQRKRKTKYIKKHVVRAEDIETAIKKSSHGSINRKCLAWYVIGHWRSYKNGKTVFISPYWKGVLRDLKRNVQGDERERVVI